MGWSETKFYAVCKVHEEFKEYLRQKRGVVKYDFIRRVQSKLMTLVDDGNITAIIFALKSAGVCDGSQPTTEEKTKDEGSLNINDYTDRDLEDMNKIHERVAKRKAKNDSISKPKR